MVHAALTISKWPKNIGSHKCYGESLLAINVISSKPKLFVKLKGLVLTVEPMALKRKRKNPKRKKRRRKRDEDLEFPLVSIQKD